MTLSQQILLNILSGSLSGGIVSFLIKTYFSTKITKSIDHQYKLKYDEYRKVIDKELEKYKSDIRIQEFVFPKKLDALKAIYTFKIDIIDPPNYPDMDWYEACDRIALSFDSYESQIDTILKEFGSILPDKVITILENAGSYCSEGKFEINDKMHVSKNGNKIASKFYDLIDESIKILKKSLNISTE